MIPEIFRTLIADKTASFVGRDHVFSAIDTFLAAHPNGYFTIEADPGAGKSAILAEYVRRIGCVAHFNMRSQGITGARQFLESIQEQLVARYGVLAVPLPAEQSQYGVLLAHLLDAAKVRLGLGDRLVIAVDALDEVDLTGHPAGANILFLPTALPDRVYFILTRRQVALPFVAQAPQQLFRLMEYPDEGLRDVQTYIMRAAERPQLGTWIDGGGLTVEQFVTTLAEKSENNFMYLRYVLSDIERGVYTNLNIEELPTGLMGYYEDHWVRMGMTTKPTPRTKIKIVYILAEVRQPVSRDLIVSFAKEDALTVQEVLDEWSQFLHEQSIDGQTRYSVYHSSFRDFLHRKDIVQAADVTLQEINGLIADDLWEGLFGDAADLEAQTAPQSERHTAPVTLSDVTLTLRLKPQGNHVQIIWEADVIGRRESVFRPPYDSVTLPLVIRALDAAQYPAHLFEGTKFSQDERNQLAAMALWSGERVAADIHRRVGRELYAALVADSEGLIALRTIRDHATAGGLPVSYVLRFTPDAVETAALPWETLWDDHGPLLLSRGKLASCVRYLDLDQALPPPARSGSKLRILAIAPQARIPDHVRIEERAARQRAWADLERAGLIDLQELSPVTPSSLVDHIQAGPPVDVIHFYGHGRYKDDQGALLLDAPRGGETWLSADRLAALLGSVRLVMLYACQSAMIGDAGLLTGVAPALSAAGAPTVVAMQLTIRVTAATRFAAVFYRSLARGDSVQRAVSQARQALYVEEGDQASWYVPTVTIRARDAGPLRLVEQEHPRP